MTEENQKKLYEHFKKLAVEGKTEKIRENAKKRAAVLLGYYPQFESKINVEPKEKTISKKKKRK